MTKEDAIEVAIAPAEGSLLEKYMAPETGLELFGLDNLSTGTKINRLFINHDINAFGTKLVSDMWKPNFTGIILGRVAQRSIFPPRGEGDDGRPPLCQSYDNVTGYATAEMRLDRTGHEADVDGVKVAITKSGMIDILPEERVALDCQTCELSNNGIRDGEAWRKPECSDLTTLIVLADFLDNGTKEVCAITFKSSGLGPVHKYLTELNELKILPLMLQTEFSLTQVEKSSEDFYSVPVLARGERTDPGENNATWEGYLEQWEQMKEVVTTPFIPAAVSDDPEPVAEAAVPTAEEDEEF